MPADPGPLYAIAAELQFRAAAVRVRAALVGASPDRVRWSSPGARAWADAVAQIHVELLRSAARIEDAAATLRTRAAQVQP